MGWARHQLRKAMLSLSGILNGQSCPRSSCPGPDKETASSASNPHAQRIQHIRFSAQTRAIGDSLLFPQSEPLSRSKEKFCCKCHWSVSGEEGGSKSRCRFTGLSHLGVMTPSRVGWGAAHQGASLFQTPIGRIWNSLWDSHPSLLSQKSVT